MCCVCNVRFHPEWWASWGFQEVGEELMELAKQLNLEHI
jgi:hypothetical protein